jgi:hypothetical protein
MYCICCKKNNVIPLDITSKWVVDKPNEEDLLWKNERDEHSKETRYKTIQNEMINNGIIDIIDAGYGSTHDGDRIILAICDDCIKENLEDGTLLYFNNYFIEVMGEGEADKSKKIYQRRKRLDDLID